MAIPKRTLGILALAGLASVFIGQAKADDEPGHPGVTIYLDVNFNSPTSANGPHQEVQAFPEMQVVGGTGTPERLSPSDSVVSAFTDADQRPSAAMPKLQEFGLKGKVIHLPPDSSMIQRSASAMLSDSTGPALDWIGADPADSASGRRDHQSWSDIMTFPVPESSRETNSQYAAADVMSSSGHAGMFASATSPQGIDLTGRSPAAPVPEPTTFALFGVSGVALLATRRSRSDMVNRRA